MSSELMELFPVGIRERFGKTDIISEGFTELRFRCNGPVMLLRGREESFLHKNGGILVVDSAHGAHLGFSDYFPKSARELGADIVIERNTKRPIHRTRR